MEDEVAQLRDEIRDGLAKLYVTHAVDVDDASSRFCSELHELKKDLATKLSRPLKRSLPKTLAKTQAVNLAKAFGLAPSYGPNVNAEFASVASAFATENGLSGMPADTEGIAEIEVIPLRAVTRALATILHEQPDAVTRAFGAILHEQPDANLDAQGESLNPQAADVAEIEVPARSINRRARRRFDDLLLQNNPAGEQGAEAGAELLHTNLTPSPCYLEP